jgi:hypothetical protein
MKRAVDTDSTLGGIAATSARVYFYFWRFS